MFPKQVDIARFGVGAVVVYLVYVAFFFILQRQMIFPGRYHASPPGIAHNDADLEVWWIETKAGPVEAWYMPAPDASPEKPGAAVIYSHGNGELIDHWRRELGHYRTLGISLLLVEYPGYGRSAGAPSQASITETVLHAYDRLAARPEVDAGRIIAHGQSLGGGPAAVVAANRPAAGLILESTFTSVRSFAKSYWLPGFLALDPFDTLAVVKNYDGPILIIHGAQDMTIPVIHAETLAAHAKQATLITYPCGHNNCPPDWQQYWMDVTSFLAKAESLDD